jgi:hypothetical protein
MSLTLRFYVIYLTKYHYTQLLLKLHRIPEQENDVMDTYNNNSSAIIGVITDIFNNKK